MHGPVPAAWDIYAKELLPLRYGHPLWHPEPCSEFGEVRLGDVGYLREGHFTFLFNAMHDAGHSLNAVRGVPCGFEVFDPPNLMLKHLPDAITQSHMHSKNIRSATVSASTSAIEPGVSASAALRYQCSEASGALLMLKQSAHRSYIDCRMHIQKYILAHIASWLDFANGPLGIGLEEKDIIFISGHTKTSIWAEAAFDQRSSGGELVIAGGCVMPSVSGEFRVSMSHCAAAMVHAREGPPDRVAAWKVGGEVPVEKYDQSIFINYYKMKTRILRRPIVVRGAAGPHVLPDDDNPDEERSESTSSPIAVYDDELDVLSEDYDPVGILLEYILKHSAARTASATDDDLSALFQDQILPDDLENALEAIAPQVCVDDDGLGTIMTFCVRPCPPIADHADPRSSSSSVVADAHRTSKSVHRAPASVPIASFVPFSSRSTSNSPSRAPDTPSALSASLRMHRPGLASQPNGVGYISPSHASPLSFPLDRSRTSSSRPSTAYSPGFPFATSSASSCHVPPTFDAETSIREAHRREMDETKDMASSFRYLMDMDAQMEERRYQDELAEVTAHPSPLASSSDLGVCATTDCDVYGRSLGLVPHTYHSALQLAPPTEFDNGGYMATSTGSCHEDILLAPALGMDEDLDLFSSVTPSGHSLLNHVWHGPGHFYAGSSDKLDVEDIPLSRGRHEPTATKHYNASSPNHAYLNHAHLGYAHAQPVSAYLHTSPCNETGPWSDPVVRRHSLDSMHPSSSLPTNPWSDFGKRPQIGPTRDGGGNTQVQYRRPHPSSDPRRYTGEVQLEKSIVFGGGLLQTCHDVDTFSRRGDNRAYPPDHSPPDHPPLKADRRIAGSGSSCSPADSRCLDGRGDIAGNCRDLLSPPSTNSNFSNPQSDHGRTGVTIDTGSLCYPMAASSPAVSGYVDGLADRGTSPLPTSIKRRHSWAGRCSALTWRDGGINKEQPTCLHNILRSPSSARCSGSSDVDEPPMTSSTPSNITPAIRPQGVAAVAGEVDEFVIGSSSDTLEVLSAQQHLFPGGGCIGSLRCWLFGR